ncbi:hypothetical protein HDU93_003012 [Gonapodya sp. JEL0774]|nr:hypothetical protein HDU93_003012 [Gonapodya sp. JEL0774]
MGGFITMSMLAGYLIAWSGQYVISGLHLLCLVLTPSGLQPSTVYAQVNSPTDMIGPGTTVVQFTRALGSCVGIAMFTAIYQNVATARLPALVESVQKVYGLTESQMQLFLEMSGSEIPTEISSIPPIALSALRAALAEARSDGLRICFLTGIPFVILGWVLTLFLQHVTLRKTAAVKISK